MGTTAPKKPNSAVRKIAKVRLSSGQEVRAVIPGSGYEITEHNTVALRAGRARDIPGVHYRLVRGVADLAPPSTFPRINRRSKFGTPNWAYVIRNSEGEVTQVVARLRTQRHRFQAEHNLPITWTASPTVPLPPGYRVVNDPSDPNPARRG